jgi:hypothetical protein
VSWDHFFYLLARERAGGKACAASVGSVGACCASSCDLVGRVVDALDRIWSGSSSLHRPTPSGCGVLGPMPPSRKDRRSQAWWTFTRNHAITIVQSSSFKGHNWARDLLSQVQSRSCVCAALPHVATQSALHGCHPRQTTGRSGWPAQGHRDRRPWCFTAPMPVEAS